METGLWIHSVEGPDRATETFCPAESGYLTALNGAINRGRVYGSAAPLQRQKLIRIGLVRAFDLYSTPLVVLADDLAHLLLRPLARLVEIERYPHPYATADEIAAQT